MTTLAIKPTLDRRAYKLRCRFRIEPHPSESRLGREKVRIAEQFVADMHKQGWENEPQYGFLMKGPFPMIVPMVLHPKRVPTAREMLSGVMRGERFLDNAGSGVVNMLTLAASEFWEYEIKGVFSRPAIRMEYADRHEEDYQ